MPRGLYSFLKPPFEGRFFGGTYTKRNICVTKSARLMLGGIFMSQKRYGLAYCDLSTVGKKFRSEFCTTFLLKLSLRT